MSVTAAAIRPHELVWSLTNSVVAAKALHLVAELGVADAVGEAPVGVADLARHCDVDPDALDRVLRLLAAHGIFEWRDGRYAHTDASRVLCSGHPQSLRPFTRMMNLPVLWRSIAALDHSVRTGAPAIEALEADGFFGYLQRHGDEAQVFAEAMAAKARADIANVLSAYDFGPFTTIADIGGGRGHLLRAVLDAVPTATGVLFDLPDVVASAEPADRLSCRPGDFFVDALPAADAYLLMEVVHDWPDAEALAILRAIRRAATPGAVVLVIEGIAPDDGADVRVQTLDVIMLAITGGRERTADELRSLLREAGFRLTTVIDTDGPMRIAEAVAV